MNTLPPLGIVGYNNVSFTSVMGAYFDSSARISPVYDESGRTVIYHVAALRFEFWFTASNPGGPSNDPNSSTDAQFDPMRRRLMTPGADLQFAGQGMGQLSVNPAPTSPAVPGANVRPTIDPNWGPKPRQLTFENLGGANTYKATFEIDVHLLNCKDAQNSNGLIEFNYKMSWDVSDGYTKRTYSGFVRIAGSWQPGSRGLQDTADSHLEACVPPVPVGFVRKPISRSLSYDKCRLDFSFVDQQWESQNYPPQSVVLASASHTVETQAAGFVQWVATIEAEYDLARGQNAAEAWPHFQRLYKDRQKETLKYPSKNAQGKFVKQTIIPLRLVLREPGIYKRNRASFTLSYSYATDITTVLRASSLWKPVAGSDYSSWAKSMKDLRVWDARGYAGHRFNPADELIVDICAQDTTPPLPGSPPDDGKPRPDVPGTLDFPILKPAPEESWINYKLDLFIRVKHPTVLMKTLPAQASQYDASSADVNSQRGYVIPYQSTGSDSVQYRDRPTVLLQLRGWALRAGYDISPPKLTQAGGVTPAPYGTDWYVSGVVANYGVPIVRAMWSMNYVLPDPPAGGLGAPANPLLGGPAQGGSGGGPLGYITRK